jgi:hypothetical protein
MSFEIVNGYVCRDCTDVGLARKGINPAHPEDKFDPPNTTDDKIGIPKSLDPAKTSDSKAVFDAKSGFPAPDGINRPLPDGPIGTKINLLA